MTAQDLHLLLEQNRLNEEVRRVTGARPIIARQELAMLLKDMLVRANKWNDSTDAHALSRFIRGEIGPEELEQHLATHL